MDQYVHLWRNIRWPISHKKTGIEKLQWLYIDEPDSVFEIDGVRYCAELSNKSGAQLYSVEYARERFDDAALGYPNWNEGDNYARRQAVEKCEILVPDHLPLKEQNRKAFKGGARIRT